MKMAGGGVEGAGFWLPAEFLTDDDFLMDKEKFKKSNSTVPESEFCFPTEFPYDFETQTDEILEKFWMMSTSPQSTLTHLGSSGGSSKGSPNGVPSPPTTPLGKYDAVGDLIYIAAGHVAKLKLNRDFVDNGRLVPPRNQAQFYTEAKTPIPSVYLNEHLQQKKHNESCRMLYGPQQMHQNRGGIGPGAWTPRQNPTHARAVLFGGSAGGGGRSGAAAKKVCAGTGVFLPRRYEHISNSNAYASDSQRRPGRAPVQVHPYGLAQSQPQPQARTNWGSGPDYYSLLARRQALVLQQRRRNLLASLAEGSPLVSHDPYLPQEWSY